MNKVIFKYELTLKDKQSVSFPKGAKILSCQAQSLSVQIWAIVDPEETDTEIRRFEIIPTGTQFSDKVEREFLGTVQLAGGALIYHIFEIRNE